MAEIKHTKKADGRVIQVNIYLTQKEYDDLLNLVSLVQGRTFGAKVSASGIVRAALLQLIEKELG